MALKGCRARLHRRFYELHINGSSQVATRTISTMAGLWKIEEEIRGRDPAVRLTARRDRSAAIVADLFKLWETELPRISGKSKLAEAIRYAMPDLARPVPSTRPRAGIKIGFLMDG
jgi:transposase